MKTRNHECIWTEAKMKKESRRILYITMDVFVVLLCVVMTMVRSSYRENQQQSRESARKILNMYSYNLQQQLRKSEEVAEVMKGVVISYKGIPDNFDEVVRPLYFQQGWINNVDLAPNGQVTVVYPELEKKYTVIDLFQDAMTGATAQYSRDKGVMVAKGPYILDDTYRQGIVLRDPIYLQDENGNRTFWGFSDVNINLAQIVLPIMTSMDANGFNYMLYKQMSPLSEDIRLISHSKVFPREPIQVNFEWASCTWELYLEPKGGWRVTPFTEILSITGILISLLITALVNILLRLRLRNRYVRQLARLDKLTGLYNRRGFVESARHYQSEYPGRPMALALLDVDNFKFFNDRYGHEIGDKVLQHMAGSLRQILGAASILGRSGGDEFIALMPVADGKEAEEKLKAFIHSPHELLIENRSFRYTTSLGYVMYPDQVMDREDMYRFADMALYATKLRGGNGGSRYDSHMNTQERPQLGFTLKEVTGNMPMPLLIMREGGKTLELLFASDQALEFFGCRDMEDLISFAHADMSSLVSLESEKKIQSAPSVRMDLDVKTRKGIKTVWAIIRRTSSIYYGHTRYVALVKER
ncbi:diguanylate cyclase domain-containing protein [Allisonella histaminiformans]|uniref:diguanylate cyclase domain-containing protein n=1 Tax=Allisonella histaminiformans TaxID=209880 RepID=UPI0022E33817|nr:diguanylate cyclase [Allisonella histaminiformans]